MDGLKGATPTTYMWIYTLNIKYYILHITYLLTVDCSLFITAMPTQWPQVSLLLEHTNTIPAPITHRTNESYKIDNARSLSKGECHSDFVCLVQVWLNRARIPLKVCAAGGIFKLRMFFFLFFFVLFVTVAKHRSALRISTILGFHTHA